MNDQEFAFDPEEAAYIQSDGSRRRGVSFEPDYKKNYMAERRKDPEFLKKQRDYMREKMKDPKYRAEHNERSKKHYHENKDKYKEIVKSRVASGYYRELKYGVSLEDFKKMVSNRGGKCEICGSFEGEELVVDHDHKTGQVRGLLCRGCNFAIGALNDDPNLVSRAVNYLCGIRFKRGKELC